MRLDFMEAVLAEYTEWRDRVDVEMRDLFARWEAGDDTVRDRIHENIEEARHRTAIMNGLLLSDSGQPPEGASS